MTFSIVGFCERTKMTGVAITTSSISVGSRCPWVRAKAGAVSTQNITDPSIGNEVLDSMEKGFSSKEAIRKVLEDRPNVEYRQVAAIDLNGLAASFTGKHILGKHAVHSGENSIAAGNLLKKSTLPKVMTDKFLETFNMHLADRLILALLAGVESGGEEGPTHSSALLVAHEQSWPLVDLRVDWSDNCPVNELYNLWKNYKPQMESYLVRALNPSNAPSYGVPGDR